MFITAECPDCGARYRLKEALAGRPAQCKKCGAHFTIETIDAPAIVRVESEPVPPMAPARPSTAAASLTPLATVAPVVFTPFAGAARLQAVPHRSPDTYRANDDVGLDPISPLLLIVFVGLSLAGGAYAHYQLSKMSGNAAPVSPAVVWSALIAQLLLFFALVGPAVLLGIFTVSRIFKFRLPASAYVRACGVAAVPAVIAALKTVLPANPVLIILLALAIIPITFYVMKQIFSMQFGEAALALLFSGILFLMAQGLTILIVALVVVGGIFAEQAENTSLAINNNTPGTPGAMSDTAGQPLSPPKSPKEIARERLASLKAQVLSFNATRGGNQSREKLAAQVAGYQLTLESLRADLGSTGEFIEAEAAIKEAEQIAAASPSEQAPPEIFAPLSPSQTFEPDSAQLAALDEEVSFGDYKLKPPARARLDMKSSVPGGDVLSWILEDSSPATLSIRRLKRQNSRQTQPWALSRPWMRAAAEAQKLLAYESDEPAVTGTLGTLPFAEIVLPGASPSTPGGFVYASPQPESWLLIEIKAKDAQALVTLRASARTLRDAKGEAVADPFAPQRIAPRLADAPEQAAEILRRHGSAAEEPVLAQLDSVPDKRPVIALLAEIGTAKSIPALQRYANDFFAGDAARNAIQKLDPKAGDAISMALLDLESGDVIRKREAMKALAAAEPAPIDDPQRIEVAILLEQMILNGGAFDAEAAGPALARWYRAETVAQLLPTIQEERPWLSGEQKGAMMALAGTKDEQAVFPIARWLINNPEETVAALKTMGEVAEAKIIPLLNEKNAVARKGAAQVLEEIGTIKSVQGLTRATNDPRDADAKAAAQQALEAVRQRAKASRATQPAEGTD